MTGGQKEVLQELKQLKKEMKELKESLPAGGAFGAVQPPRGGSGNTSTWQMDREVKIVRCDKKQLSYGRFWERLFLATEGGRISRTTSLSKNMQAKDLQQISLQ